MSKDRIITVGRVEAIPPGRCATFELPDGSEFAIYNVDGEFYATSNFCPHKGAPLAEGRLCGYVIECALHGWQFDVRSGAGLTMNEPVERYRVVVEEGVVKVVVPGDGLAND
jgi:nitrite reductase/ring-hydroxylating ferredoxin subunit